MKCIPELGDTLRLSSFAFKNKAGGTGLSNWAHDPKFEGVAQVQVTKGWHDYECGWRFHGRPVQDPKLDAYLNANAADTVVYFSEHDVLRAVDADEVPPMPLHLPKGYKPDAGANGPSKNKGAA